MTAVHEISQTSDASPGDTRSRNPLRMAAIVVAAVLVACLVLLAGIITGRLTSVTPPPAPGTASAEAGFARDMQTHHNQAVEMSLIIYAKTDESDIRTLAYDIAASQAQQAGQMHGWLNTWGVPQAAPEPSMTWMARPALDGAAHQHGAEMAHVPGEPMPGLATPAQMEQLRSATGTEADRIFLELMIAHHIGGVDMAEAVLDRSTERVVVALADGVITVQEGEIDYMERVLTEISPG